MMLNLHNHWSVATFLAPFETDAKGPSLPPRESESTTNAENFGKVFLLERGAHAAAVHDWGSESGPGDISDIWNYLLHEECEAMASLTRYFAFEPDLPGK